MSRKGQRASTLLEVTVAAAIIAIVVGAVLGAGIAAIRHFGPDAAQSALHEELTQQMRLAVDVLKYDGATIAPASIATTIPCASSAPFPATIAIDSTAAAGGGVKIRLTASTTNPARRASLETTLTDRAPAPGSAIVDPQPVAQPLGAP